jgi:hypothetical protein
MIFNSGGLRAHLKTGITMLYRWLTVISATREVRLEGFQPEASPWQKKKSGTLSEK